MSAPSLLTVGNPKTEKGAADGYLTAILHLAPYNLSGFQVCRHASPGCAAACLNTAGRGGIFKRGETTNAIQTARIRKTRELFADPDAFMARLADDIDAHVRRAARLKMSPAVRLNGTSDLPWERMRTAEGRTLLELFAGRAIFYDYTKVPNRPATPGYHLTFSLSETNEAAARAELGRGRNVAAVFPRGHLPAVFLGRPVIDGDRSDLRFLDPDGVVVGLSAKGRARRDALGFVQTLTV